MSKLSMLSQCGRAKFQILRKMFFQFCLGSGEQEPVSYIFSSFARKCLNFRFYRHMTETCVEIFYVSGSRDKI